MRIVGLAIALTFSVLSAFPAQAATTLITTQAGYTGPGLDLSAFADGNIDYTFGPITVGQYTLTTTPDFVTYTGDGAAVGQGDYGLGDNGRFGGDAVYIGQDTQDGDVNLMLNGGPVSQLGFFMNYVPSGVARDVTIAALDSMGNVFASYDIQKLAPISTPGGFNQTEFRGIASDTPNIYGLRFGGNYLLVTGTPDGTLPAVPEPMTWALMLLGMFGIGGVIRRSGKVSLSATSDAARFRCDPGHHAMPSGKGAANHI